MTTPHDAREMVKGMLKTIAEQNDEIERMKAERDALRAVIDQYVAARVWAAPFGEGWEHSMSQRDRFPTRELAEAAYRERCGFPPAKGA